MPKVPAYFDGLLAAFWRGRYGRYVHLGYFDDPRETLGRDPRAFVRGQERLDRQLIALAAIRDGEAVLDIGCGLGGTLQAIDGAHSGMRLVGLNIDKRQLDACRTLSASRGNRLAWVVGDAVALPFADASFQLVLSIEAMFHFASRRAFFAEVARVLKPGGVLVASDIVVSPGAGELRIGGVPATELLRRGYGPWPDLGGAEADHRALASDAGLSGGLVRDASAETLPSHDFTLPADGDEGADPEDEMLQAGLALRKLQREGLARYVYMRFDKPA